MLKRLLGITTKQEPKQPDPAKRVVTIRLAGIVHTFYLPVSFAEQLRKALEVSPDGGFLTYETEHASYAINLDCIDYVHMLDKPYHIDSDTPLGFTAYLVCRKKPFELGVLNEEQINEGRKFLRMGSYYFKKDQVSLIVVKRDQITPVRWPKSAWRAAHRHERF